MAEEGDATRELAPAAVDVEGVDEPSYQDA